MATFNRRTQMKTEKRRALLTKLFNRYPTGLDHCFFHEALTTSEMNSMLNGYGLPSEKCQHFSKTDKIRIVLNDGYAFSILEGHGYSKSEIAVFRREFRRDLAAIGAHKAQRMFLEGSHSIRLEHYLNAGEIESPAYVPGNPYQSDPMAWLKLYTPDPDQEPAPIETPIEHDGTLPPAPAPAPAPEPAPATKEVKIPEGTDPMTTLIASAIVPIVRDALRAEDDALTEKKVIDMISTEVKARMPHMIQPAPPPGGDTPPVELAHEAFPQVFKTVQCDLNAMLIGPAGSGKTSVAEQIAKSLAIPFRFTGAVDSPYKLTGFVDANGKTVRTAFRETYENGGLFLFDEVDASSAGAMMAFNAALANGHADFPDGVIERHKDFRCIAAANTFGRGADRIYVGRNALDGATLDRFVVVDFDYDEALETALAGDDMIDWVRRVQAIRKAVFKLKLRFVVSPRASIFGSRLLRAGMSRQMVEEMVIWKGMDKEARTKINAEVM